MLCDSTYTDVQNRQVHGVTAGWLPREGEKRRFGGNWGIIADEYRVGFWRDENVLKLVEVIVTQILCPFNEWIVWDVSCNSEAQSSCYKNRKLEEPSLPMRFESWWIQACPILFSFRWSVLGSILDVSRRFCL